MIMRITALIISLAAATGACGQGRLAGSGGTKRFVSERYGFTIAVPPGWYVSLDKDTPMYVNFGPDKALPQLRLPPGGASIVVVAQETLPGQPRLGSTPTAWAMTDARGVSSTEPSVRPFEVPTASGMTDAVITSYDEATYGPGDQPQHCVAIFWRFAGKLFAAHLNYITNDPNSAAIEKVSFETIRSIRPLEKSGKR